MPSGFLCRPPFFLLLATKTKHVCKRATSHKKKTNSYQTIRLIKQPKKRIFTLYFLYFGHALNKRGVVRGFFVLFFGLFGFFPCAAWASYDVQGTVSGSIWLVPFGGLLLSLAFLPFVAPSFWHKRFPLITYGWCIFAISLLLVYHGAQPTAFYVRHTLLHHFFPFALMIGALYTLAGHLHVDIFLKGTPTNNTFFLGITSLLSSVLGTTGASMLFIHPLLKMNKIRTHKTHTVVFFIFLLSHGCQIL